MTASKTNPETAAHPYQIFMLALCLYALAALAVDSFFALPPDTRTVLFYGDTAVCAVFFFDFVYNMVRAPNKVRYFYTWGWIDLISSIPSVGILRAGRTVQVIRILRVLRGVRATKVLAEFLLAKRAEAGLMAAALISILFIVAASIFVLQFERDASSTIKTAGDAVWWALTTVTTVGYGDTYPVTRGGRIVAVVLMTAGVFLLATFSGFVASWFLAPIDKEQNRELEKIRREVAELRAAIERLGPHGLH